MIVNIAAGSMGTAWAAVCLGMPITMFMKALGASGLQIGLLMTVQQLAVLGQMPATLFIERMTRRKRLWGVLAVAHRALWLVPAALPFLFDPGSSAIPKVLIWTVAASALLANASTPCWFSWMADLIPQRLSGRFWGIRQSLVMVAFLVSTFVAGRLLDFFPDPASGGGFTGFAILFALAASLGMADILLHLTIPEPVPQRPDGQASLGARLLAPLKVTDFRWLTWAMGLWVFSAGLHASFVPVYLRETFAFSYVQLSVLPMLAAAGSILSGLPLGRLIDRIGARTVGVLLMVLAPFTGLVWFFLSPKPVHLDIPWLGAVQVPQAMLVLGVGHVLGGALYGGVGLCQVHLAGVLAPRTGRAMAMAVHWSIVGVMAALGPLLGGLCMDHLAAHPLPLRLPLDMPVSYLQVLVAVHLLVAWTLCAQFLGRIRRKATELPLRLVFSKLNPGNPLRAMVHTLNESFAEVIAAVQRRVWPHDSDAGDSQD
jgi:MFS family permease